MSRPQLPDVLERIIAIGRDRIAGQEPQHQHLEAAALAHFQAAVEADLGPALAGYANLRRDCFTAWRSQWAVCIALPGLAPIWVQYLRGPTVWQRTPWLPGNYNSLWAVQEWTDCPLGATRGPWTFCAGMNEALAWAERLGPSGPPATTATPVP